MLQFVTIFHLFKRHPFSQHALNSSLEKLEARVGIEPTHRGFADLGLTTWLPRPEKRSTSAKEIRRALKTNFPPARSNHPHQMEFSHKLFPSARICDPPSAHHHSATPPLRHSLLAASPAIQSIRGVFFVNDFPMKTDKMMA